MKKYLLIFLTIFLYSEAFAVSRPFRSSGLVLSGSVEKMISPRRIFEKKNAIEESYGFAASLDYLFNNGFALGFDLGWLNDLQANRSVFYDFKDFTLEEKLIIMMPHLAYHMNRGDFLSGYIMAGAGLVQTKLSLDLLLSDNSRKTISDFINNGRFGYFSEIGVIANISSNIAFGTGIKYFALKNIKIENISNQYLEKLFSNNDIKIGGFSLKCFIKIMV